MSAEEVVGWIVGGVLIAFFAVAGLALFVGVPITEYLAAKERRLRARDPSGWLADWARRNQKRLPEDRVALERECPQCRKGSLEGRDIPLEQISGPDGPPAAWALCLNCGFKEAVVVAYPWTRTQGDAARDEVRGAEERRVINDFLERKRLERVSTERGLRSLTPKGFEHAVAEILAAHGYQDGIVRGGPGDLAVDLTALNPRGDLVAVQCKQYADKPVGSRELQTFIGMIHAHHAIATGIYVTTSRFTAPAKSLARQHNIELLDGAALIRLAEPLKSQIDPHEGRRIRALEMWNVIQNEQRAEAARAERARQLERRRQAREWARKIR